MAQRYTALLSQLEPIITPYENDAGLHVYHQYTLLTPMRAEIMAALQTHRVASAIYYPIPLHKQDVFANALEGLSLPISEWVSSQCLSLPICPELTDTQIDTVVDIIKQTVDKKTSGKQVTVSTADEA